MSIANKKLRTFVSEAAPGVDVGLDHRVEVGDPLQRIVEDADAYDLITMGTHGNTEGGRIIGSVADAVVRNASCPVLTVRTSSR